MDTLSSTAIRKVSRELHSLDNDPPEGIRLIANEESIADIQAWIKGPGTNPAHSTTDDFDCRTLFKSSLV